MLFQLKALWSCSSRLPLTHKRGRGRSLTPISLLLPLYLLLHLLSPLALLWHLWISPPCISWGVWWCPLYKKAKHQVFKLLVLTMVSHPILYGKGKGPYGVTSMSWPSWSPIAPTPWAVNWKRPVIKVFEYDFPPISILLMCFLLLLLSRRLSFHQSWLWRKFLWWNRILLLLLKQWVLSPRAEEISFHVSVSAEVRL